MSAPGPAVSLIQLDAYKKLVLVQLLAYGKVCRLPYSIAIIVARLIKVDGCCTDSSPSEIHHYDRLERIQDSLHSLQRLRIRFLLVRQDESCECS